MTTQSLTAADMMSAALEHLVAALELLDQCGAPGHIGSHIDLASHQLEEALRSAGEAPRSFMPNTASCQ